MTSTRYSVIEALVCNQTRRSGDMGSVMCSHAWEEMMDGGAGQGKLAHLEIQQEGIRWFDCIWLLMQARLTGTD